MKELEKRLRRIRAAVARRRPREAWGLADRALADAAQFPELAVLASLAARDLARAGSGPQLTESLAAGLGNPEDRIDGWIAVAEDADQRRQWGEAEQAWICAVQESNHRPDLVLALAGSLLRAGRNEDALVHLIRATESPDTATSLAAWLLLSGQYLAEKQMDPALAAAQEALVLAEGRHNWLAFAAAAIDISEVQLVRQDPKVALQGLMAALKKCRRRGDPGTLLVARFLEIRSLGSA